MRAYIEIASSAGGFQINMITLNLNPELKPVPQPAYIEIQGGFSSRRWELNEWNLCGIGEFTRENIQRWLERRYRAISGPDPLEADILGDFHAVCGDIDIPWATEKARLDWGCETTCDECGQEHDWRGIPLGRGRSRICVKCRKEELEY